MNTKTDNIFITIPNFSGIVIDPTTGRQCALQIDLFRGLGLAGNQVTATKARVYQGRFFDLVDVLEARAKVRPQGCKQRGMVNIENLNPENQY